MSFNLIYTILTAVIVCGGILVAVLSFLKKTRLGTTLGLTALFAIIVEVSYGILVFTKDYFSYSVLSSIYFFFIDLMLAGMLSLMLRITGFWKKRLTLLTVICIVICACEMLVFAINPFFEIAISYQKTDRLISIYNYIMKPLYIFHLCFTYAMIAASIFLIISKMVQVTKEYRTQYVIIIAGIVFLVGLNAVYLFASKDSVFSYVDLSVLGYNIVLFLIFWSCFYYSTHAMKTRFETYVFESINQGIVMFGNHNRLILKNKKASELLRNIDLSEHQTFDKFLQDCNLSLSPSLLKGNCSIQCYTQDEKGNLQPTRCDYKPVLNQTEQLIGKLFVFTDASLETDLLTGFPTQKSFSRIVHDGLFQYDDTSVITAFDIDGLSGINSAMGRDAGDKRICDLAACLKKEFPSDTYFFRGTEATLYAITYKYDNDVLMDSINKVTRQFEDVQYGISRVSEESGDILQSVESASFALNNKKLLNKSSQRSNSLSSIIRALKECDSDTEAHVMRTRMMGQALGERMHLSDMQLSRLAILCLLHDIGKIGIPLEILNKPGKLEQSEWEVVKSHVYKGYQIALSSSETAFLADQILYHHERWDGTGYPSGLSRESIPLLSRIISVVDAYDAMTNNRSYRRAMPSEEALNELKRCAGTQFDPSIVTELIKLIHERPDLAGSAPAQAIDESSKKEIESIVPEVNDLSDSNSYSIAYSRYVIDRDMNIIDMDDTFTAITGYTREDVEQQHLNQLDLLPLEDRPDYLKLVNQSLASAPIAYIEHRILGKNGNVFYVFCLGKDYYDSISRSYKTEIIIANCSQTHALQSIVSSVESKAKERLQRWEDTFRRDPLTGLYNHAAFQSEVEMKLLSANQKVLLLMMDIDHFKQYNDTKGHHMGDQFLVTFSQILDSAMRSEDLCCRMGGDEFSAALSFDRNVSDEQIFHRANQIFDKISMMIVSEESHSGVSMGAVISANDDSFNSLYEAADQALYESKEKGRGRLTCHNRKKGA